MSTTLIYGHEPAYLKLKLNKSSQRYVVILINKVIFCDTSLPVQNLLSTCIFHWVIRSHHQTIPGLVIYLDDTGKDGSAHLSVLENILSHINYTNIHVCLSVD